MLSGLQLQMCSCDTPLIQVVRKGWLLSVRKFCFLTPNIVSKPQFPQSLYLFSIALQWFISDSLNKCRAML